MRSVISVSVRERPIPRGVMTTLLTLGLCAGGLACEGNSMNRDLKRQADRATIQLNRVENERDTLRAELETTKAALETERKRTEGGGRESEEMRRRVTKLEADLLTARQRVRELEEAALAARQGMPTTRAVQP